MFAVGDILFLVILHINKMIDYQFGSLKNISLQQNHPFF